MAELVIAPALKPMKDGVKTFVRMSFQLAEDGDVAGVANFFGKVGRVKNVLGLEVGEALVRFRSPRSIPKPKSLSDWLIKLAWRDSSRAI